jgi:hypothetical protein
MYLFLQGWQKKGTFAERCRGQDVGAWDRKMETLWARIVFFVDANKGIVFACGPKTRKEKLMAF